MAGWNRLLARITNTFRHSKVDRELHREISSHLSLIEDDFTRRGMSPADARSAAQRAYGNVTQVKELHHEERSFLWLEQALFDLRYAVRGFRKSKMFTGVAVLTLALGIGANAAIFSIINTVLFHPLPYPDTDRLLAISSYNPGSPVNIVSLTRLNYMQPQIQSLEGIGAYYALALNVTTKGSPEQVIGAHVSRELFQLLGAEPALGRGFLPEEDQLGGKDVALISNAFWRSHFAADSEIAGKSVLLDGRITTIVGVLPPGFRFPFFQPEPQVWLPRVIENPNYSPQRIRGGVAYLLLIGKLRRGEGLQHLRAELDSFDNGYRQAFPSYPDAGMTLTAAPLDESLVANVRPSLLALQVAAGFVLLIGCVNVASLLLARAISREKEIGIRRALGAARGRLIRQLLTESLALSFLGGGFGIALAAFCLPQLMRMLTPGTIPLSDLVHLNRAVALISFALCVLTGIIFGLAPALQASPRDLNEKLKQGNRGSTSSGGRARQAMVVCEVALTLMLMTGAGLLLKSVINLMRVSPGFVSRNVITFFVSLPPAQYPQPSQRLVFYHQLLDQVAALPGVNSASVVSHLPLAGGGRFMFVCPEGRVCQGVGKDPLAAWRQVSPDFFRSMRIPLLHGRAFDERDRADSPLVAIVNQTIASRYFPGINPVGRHIAASRDRIPMEIVGVVPNLKFVALTAPDSEEIYVPYTQTPWPSMTLVVRSNPSLAPPVAAVRHAISRIDPDVPLAQIQSLDQLVTGSIAQPRLIAGLVSSFALAALFLAAVGIYGVMAYLVTQRSPEIAIRMALGAQRWSVFRLMVSHGMKLVVMGLALGLTMSLAMTRLLSKLLFGASPTDLFTLTAVCLVFAAVAFAACYIPSRRAMRLDALATLRSA